MREEQMKGDLTHEEPLAMGNTQDCLACAAKVHVAPAQESGEFPEQERLQIRVAVRATRLKIVTLN